MIKIKVIATPKGTEPEVMRQALVNCVIVIDEGAVARQIGKVGPKDPDHHVMPSDVVSALVAAGRMREADFWKKTMGPIFHLQKSDCEVIEH